MKYGLLHDGLRRWAVQAPDRPAMMLDGGEALSYAQLDRWSDGIAEHLQEMGVKPGDRVAITGANSIPWVPAAFGILKAGAVKVPINDRFVHREMAHVLERTESRVIIADPPRAEIIAGDGIPILDMEALDPFRGGARPGWRRVEVSPDSCALVIFTSGTTGEPKGVMFGHSQQLDKFAEFFIANPGCNVAPQVFLPFALHAAPGSQWGYFLTTIAGGTMHYFRRFDPELSLKVMTRHRTSVLFGMPVIYEQLCRLPAFAEADLSCVTLAQVGGARMQPEITRVWREKGVVIRQLYGMTEVGGCGIIASAEDALIEPDSCGRAMPFTRVRIVDDAGNDCPPDTEGNVLLRGPGMMLGYWKNPEATAQAIDADGWMHTGDIGVVTGEGFFFFVDRAKDIIISGGFNISPSEVERILMTFPGVLEVSVFAVPHEKFGEVPGAAFHADRPIDTDALFAHCKANLAGFKLPRHLFQHGEPLPRKASNKIDKQLLVKAYAAPIGELQKA